MASTKITERAARWRANSAPEDIGALDQIVAARRDILDNEGPAAAGASALLAVQEIYKGVTNDSRTGHDCPCCETLKVVAEQAYIQGEIASHMMETATGPTYQ